MRPSQRLTSPKPVAIPSRSSRSPANGSRFKAAAADGDTSFALTAGPNRLQAKVAKTASWDRLETIELGELSIAAPGILRVELRPDTAGWSPLNLASLSFEPITRKSN